MVTISGEFIRTRLILILWPQLLLEKKAKDKKNNITLSGQSVTIKVNSDSLEW